MHVRKFARKIRRVEGELNNEGSTTNKFITELDSKSEQEKKYDEFADRYYNSLLADVFAEPSKGSKRTFSEAKISVTGVKPKPTEEELKELGHPPKGLFSTFDSDQIGYAMKIIGLLRRKFLQPSDNVDIDRVEKIRVYAQQLAKDLKLQKLLINYAIQGTLLHSGNDTLRKFAIAESPSIRQQAPEKFFIAVMPSYQPSTISSTSNNSTESVPATEPIPIFETATEANPEFKLAWFREDYMLNAHHWHWHLVFPSTGIYKGNTNTLELTNPSRQGELFFFMHRQMLARYDTERISVGLGLVEPLGDYKKKLIGYFPHLIYNSSRPDDMTMKDMTGVKVSDLETWRNNLQGGIDRRSFVPHDENDEAAYIDKINHLGCYVERNLTPDPNDPQKQYYGNLHNMGHNVISRIHDPLNIHNSPIGVIGDTIGSCRDPVFWQWHRHIDDFCTMAQKLFRPYRKQEFIRNENVTLDSFAINSTDLKTTFGLQKLSLKEDVVGTALQTVPGEGPVLTKTANDINTWVLQPEDFKYTFHVSNNSDNDVPVVLRIFAAAEQLQHDRRMWIEMDKFEILVNANTQQFAIERLSKESSILQSSVFSDPFDPSNIPATKTIPDNSWCVCGWPYRLLLPRGTEEGMQFKFFAMVDIAPERSNNCCGSSFCGLRDYTYPDDRAMGFPFDRPFDAQADLRVNVDELSAAYPQIKILDAKITMQRVAP